MRASFRILLLILTFCLFRAGQTTAQCSFTVSDPDPCAGTEVDFSVDAPSGGVSYEWDLDYDGETDLSGSAFSYSFPVTNSDTDYPIVLYADGDSCSTQLITVTATPDASIGVPPGIVLMIGNELKACNGSSTFDLEIFNTSATYATNASYTINWGDGSPPEQYDNTTFSNTSTISHTYVGLGYYTIFVTVTGQNGCVFTENYTFYNGGNPSVGLVIPGNTVGLCAPATLDFPIINTESNPPGTEYQIFINGQEVGAFTQDSLPSVFTYTFLESSCGATTSTGNYNNAFDIRIVASNPCNSSTATIEPIEVSEPPEPFFAVQPPAYSCAGATFTLVNGTTGVSEVISGNPSSCIEVLNPNWTISGTAGEDWLVASGNLFGSEEIAVQFLEPGVYTIEMTVVSFACGPYTFTQTITIFEPPSPIGDFPIGIAPAGNGEGCAPLDFQLSSGVTGDSVSYQWNILPTEGWEWVDSTGSPTVRFLEGGAFDIRLTATNPCAELNWDTTFTVPGPPAVDLSPLSDFCNQATLSFDSTTLTFTENGSPITQFNWSFPGALTPEDTVAYPQNILYETPGTYTVELTASNSCGEQTVQDTFVVQTATQLQLPPAATLCELDEPLALADNPGGGSWSGPGLVNGNAFSPTLAGPGDHVLTYSYGVGACFIEDQVTFSVQPAPQVIASAAETVCSNAAPVDLTGAPQGGVWSGGPDGALNDDSFLPDVAGAGQFTLTYTFTAANGCGATDTTLIEVLTVPDITAADTSYCNTPGDVPLPSASPAGGVWSGPGVTDPGGLFNPFAAGGAGSYQLTYAVSADNGCDAQAGAQVGVVDPASVDAGPNADLCAGDAPYPLSAQATPAGGSWWLNGSPLGGSQFDPGAVGGGAYTLTYRVGSGNCQVEDQLTVEVTELQVAAGSTLSLCQDAPALTLNGGSPAGGQWSGTGVSGANFDPATAGAGDHILTYTITDNASGCQQSDEMSVTVHPLPLTAFALPEAACVDQPIAFENQSTGAAQYEWSFGDGISSPAEIPNHAYESSGNYTVQLTALSAAGCEAAAAQPLLIADPPVAAFIPDSEQACGELNLQLQDQSDGYQPSYFWDYGNGETSTAAQPAGLITYPGGQNDTTYLIRLEVTNLCGSDTYQDSVEVLAFPIVDFGFTVDTGCAPLTVTFANISFGSPESWFWNFGNGQTATDSLPGPQTFDVDTAAVTYPVTLIANNSCGSDTLTRPLVVEPEVVQAFFNTSNTVGCAPFEVDFTSFSTPGAFVSWDFGDGNQVDGQAVSHTFQEPGLYTIRQYAANSCAEDSTTAQIEVLPAPEVSFEFSPNLCTGQEVQFTNTSANLAGSSWDFGTSDSSALTNPVYIYQSTGQYTVTLTGLAPGTGCSRTASLPITIHEAPRPAFSIDAAEGCTPLTVQFSNQSEGGNYYQWTFGDGNSSAAAEPGHTYLSSGHFTVNLRVQDARGCYMDSTYNDVFAFPTPTADFEVAPEAECGLPVTVHFENNSTDADGFFWELGDGLSSTLVNPSQAYTTPGWVEAGLLAVNAYGCRDSTTLSFQVVEQPVAEFDLDSLLGCQPLGVQFRNYSSGDQFFWDLGDGNTSTEPEPFHTYVEAGAFPVSLVAAYEDQCFDTLTLPGLVTVLSSPVAAFNWEEEDPGNPTGSLQFINLSEGANSFKWNFGDGTTSVERDPFHRYYENGLWQVRLTAASADGCTDEAVAQIDPGFIRGLFVPNAFAPEYGAGDVRLFKPVGIGLKEYRLQIFSPYGQLLWETTELRDGRPLRGWSGTMNGNPLPQDVYVWKIQAVFEDGAQWRGVKTRDGSYQRMGSVTLLR